MSDIRTQAAQNKFMTVGAHTYGQAFLLRTWRHVGGCIENTKLTIGKFCSLADGIEVFLGGNHLMNCVTTFPIRSLGVPTPIVEGNNGDIVIQDDVWVGSRAVIMSGVTIGYGACIGAHAVVAKNIPPYAVAVGNPARVVKMRFSDDVIKRLLEMRWWDWPLDQIKRAGALLKAPEIDKVFAFYEGMKK